MPIPYGETVAADGNSGGIIVVCYAGTADGDSNGSVRLSRSVDGAATFSPSTVIHQPVTFLQSRTSLKWIGEYFGVAWRDGDLYTAYVDNSGLESHIAFHRTAIP